MGEPLVLEKFSRHIPSLMMKYLLIALAITAISAEILDEVAPHDDTTSLIDEFLENDMQLPCTPKACKPVCKLVTKYVQYGAYKLPYEENVCEPDKKCLADAAACIAKLQAAMKAAEAAEKDMIAKAKLANAAKATHAQKAAAAAAKKKEEAAAASAMAAAKAQFEAAEKAAAMANAAKVASAKTAASKAAAMAKALQKFEATKKLHLAAQAAYAGAKSAAAKALADYNAAVKAHCDAEALHAKAVTAIGHGHMAKSTCAKPKPKPKPVVKTKYTHWRGGNGGGARSGRCPGNSYINYWTIRSGTLVDNIRGRCSNGSWLTSCGGGGGGSWTGKADTRRIYVRSGSLIDKFNNRGGNGGGGGWLDCGSGYKITGYDVRCGSLVDKVRFQCKNVR